MMMMTTSNDDGRDSVVVPGDEAAAGVVVELALFIPVVVVVPPLFLWRIFVSSLGGVDLGLSIFVVFRFLDFTLIKIRSVRTGVVVPLCYQ